MKVSAHPSHRLFLAAAAGERPGTRRPPGGEEPAVQRPEGVAAPERPATWAADRAADLALELHQLGKAGVPAR